MKQKNHTFVIAEAGVNHNGSVDLAKRLVDVAAAAGADAVKFQSFRSAALATEAAAKADYQVARTGSGESQLSMLRRLELDEAAHFALAKRCRDRGVVFLSSPFDEESLALLDERIGVPMIKIASGEITNGPLLLAAARTKKPIILSTGMSTLAEVWQALWVIAFGYTRRGRPSGLEACRKACATATGRQALRRKVTLLHCTTEYPAAFSDVNLLAMDTLRARCGLRVGLSDHTPGIATAIAAVARGATVVEKHFTLDRELPGPDHRASLEPDELQALVKAVREVEKAMGSAHKAPVANERRNRQIVRKSLVAARTIPAGERLSAGNLACKRPGTGLAPMRYWQVLGRRAKKRFRKDDLIEL